MANPEHLGKLNEGVEAWNHWKAGRAIFADLNGADLSGKDLSGADLRGANFEGANLRGAKLGSGTLLWNANLSRADLYQANLSGAELQDVNFTGADLFEAKLREANLQGADLTGANGGLQTEQLAGANLTGAKLPEPLKKLYDGLDNVKGISESARKIFLAVLAGCLYCWLTIATTTNVNLITNRASSPLPIIQTPIPIVGFYIVGPLLVLCVYFYFHFYLQKLWEELGSLPAVFPDGRPLHTKVDPWLLNDLVRSHLPKLNVDRPFLSYLQLWISVLLAWWVVPITLLLFWGRYLRRHESIGTAFHVALFVVSLVAGVCLYRLALTTLHGDERRPFTLKGSLGPFTWRGTSRRRRLLAGLAALGLPTLLGASLIPPSHFVLKATLLIGGISLVAVGCVYWLAVAIIGLYELTVAKMRGGERKSFMALTKTVALALAAAVVFTLVSREAGGGTPNSSALEALDLLGYSAFANLAGAEVSQKKPTSNGKNDKDPDSVIGAQLQTTNLRYALAEYAFLVGADLSHADLSGADLRGAQLTRADLTGTILTRANLSGSDLSGDAHLGGAKLDGSDLTGANLTHAILSGADLDGADLSGAYLSGADFSGAHLHGADLSDADLIGAHLDGADLGSADLRYVKLGKYSGMCVMCRADLTLADLRHIANLSPEHVKGAAHWELALYDEGIRIALGLPDGHNEQVEEQRKKQRNLQQKQNTSQPAPKSSSQER